MLTDINKLLKFFVILNQINGRLLNSKHSHSSKKKNKNDNKNGKLQLLSRSRGNC